MNYDMLTGLPTIESFLDFTSKMWSSSPKSRFALLGVYFNDKHYYESYSEISSDNVLIQKFIKNHHLYMLSACKIDNGIFLVLLDKTAIILDNVKSQITTDLEDFYNKVSKLYPTRQFLVHCGLCNLDENIQSIHEGMTQVLTALNTLPVDDSSICKIAEYAPNENEKVLVTLNSESKIIPLFQDIMNDNQILVYLQPKFEIDCDKPVGAEALVRILDDSGALLKPKDFLTILENHNLSYKLDLMVIEKMLKQLSSWKEDALIPIPISVNLSAVDFINQQFEKIIHELIEKYEDVVKFLEFEISEEAYLDNPSYIEEKINKLHKMGFKVAIDGFGRTSNLQTELTLPPVDSIKLDRNYFLLGMQNSNNSFILKKICKLCADCNISVICEGIETQNAENFARNCGISLVQGFFYDKPVPLDIFKKKYMDYNYSIGRA